MPILRRSASQPKATRLRTPKAPDPPPPPPPKPTAAHYRTLLPTYWAKAHGPEVLADFAARVRGDLEPHEIKNDLIPYLVSGSLGTTGIQINRLKAALLRVAEG